MVHGGGPVGLHGIAVGFDDERAVADAGVVLVGTLASRLGIEALVDERVDLGERDGAGNAGAKVMTLVSAMALGADCIDDCDMLRSGRTAEVLGHRVLAPSTDVSARVHLRARPATRPCPGRGDPARVGRRRRARRRAPGDRCRLFCR